VQCFPDFFFSGANVDDTCAHAHANAETLELSVPKTDFLAEPPPNLKAHPVPFAGAHPSTNPSANAVANIETDTSSNV